MFAGMARMMFDQMFIDGCDTAGRDAIVDRALSLSDMVIRHKFVRPE